GERGDLPRAHPAGRRAARAGQRDAPPPRPPLPRHVTHRPLVVWGTHGRARGEHHPRDDQELPFAEGRARRRYRVRRSPRAPRRLGSRGRAPARALSSRPRPRARRGPRAPRLADLDRAVAGLTAVLCAAAIVAATVGPFWRIREVSVEGAHHVTVDTVVSASALDGAQTFTASA